MHNCIFEKATGEATWGGVTWCIVSGSRVSAIVMADTHKFIVLRPYEHDLASGLPDVFKGSFVAGGLDSAKDRFFELLANA